MFHEALHDKETANFELPLMTKANAVVVPSPSSSLSSFDVVRPRVWTNQGFGGARSAWLLIYFLFYFTLNLFFLHSLQLGMIMCCCVKTPMSAIEDDGCFT